MLDALSISTIIYMADNPIEAERLARRKAWALHQLESGEYRYPEWECDPL